MSFVLEIFNSHHLLKEQNPVFVYDDHFVCLLDFWKDNFQMITLIQIMGRHMERQKCGPSELFSVSSIIYLFLLSCTHQLRKSSIGNRHKGICF